MGLSEIGQSVILSVETKLPVGGSYSTGSKLLDEGIASFLDLLPGCQMANLYPLGTLEGNSDRKVQYFEGNWPSYGYRIRTEEEARTVGTEDIREGSDDELWQIGDYKDLLGIGHMASNSNCFVVRS